MPDQHTGTRAQEFQANLPLWIVVHHLLPADLLRELAAAMVARASEATSSLSIVFDELPPHGLAATSSWFVAGRGGGPAFTDHLSRLVETMIWRGDDVPFPPQQGIDAREARWIRVLNGALALSSRDLSKVPTEIDDALDPVREIVDAMSLLKRAVESGAQTGAVAALVLPDHAPHPARTARKAHGRFVRRRGPMGPG